MLRYRKSRWRLVFLTKAISRDTSGGGLECPRARSAGRKGIPFESRTSHIELLSDPRLLSRKTPQHHTLTQRNCDPDNGSIVIQITRHIGNIPNTPSLFKTLLHHGGSIPLDSYRSKIKKLLPMMSREGGIRRRTYDDSSCIGSHSKGEMRNP